MNNTLETLRVEIAALVSSYAKEKYKVNRTIARVNDAENERAFNELGIDVEAAEALEIAILGLHSPIAQHFNSGIGLKLQRIDSDIAMSVIDHFVNVLKRPIVSIHDSFISLILTAISNTPA